MTDNQNKVFAKYNLTVTFSTGDNPCIHIENSHNVKERATMEILLDYIHSTEDYKKLLEAGFTRTKGSQLREWIGHNFLYNVGYKGDQTGSVDIDQNEPKWRRFLYAIFSIFY